jgi:hypothetical protein
MYLSNSRLKSGQPPKRHAAGAYSPGRGVQWYGDVVLPILENGRLIS